MHIYIYICTYKYIILKSLAYINCFKFLCFRLPSYTGSYTAIS